MATNPSDVILKELDTVIGRVQLQANAAEVHRSQLLSLSDRCYAAGLAYAYEALTGESRDQVIEDAYTRHIPKPKPKRSLKKKKRRLKK